MAAWPGLEPRISTGFLNTVNDAIDGDPTATAYINAGYLQGQLGKVFQFDDFNVVPVTSASVGTLYGGFYQYVKLKAGVAVPVLGQALFWDIPDIPTSPYQVTTNQLPSGTDAACQMAGVCINAVWTAGNYAFIQIAGHSTVQYRAALTNAGAINGPVYVASAGGADLGFFDVVEAGGVGTGDIRRYAGTQFTAAANGALGGIILPFMRLLF